MNTFPKGRWTPKPDKVTTHTPGPWTHKATATPDYARQYAVYPEADGRRDVAIVYDGEQAKANACLVAAAPEMLEALLGIAGICEITSGGFIPDIKRICQTAIQKAQVQP